MGIYMEKSSLSDDAMTDDVTTACARDSDYAMAAVTMKAAPHAFAWNMNPKDLDGRDAKASLVRSFQGPPVACSRWTPFESSVKPSYCRRMPFSRKRRLTEVADRPTKHLRLSKDEHPTCRENVCRTMVSETKSQVEALAKLSSPRTLHFALPRLSSGETLQLLGELVSARHELSWLNSTRPLNAPVMPVFGWRSAVWSLTTPQGNDTVVYKSAKAFEGVGMHDVARQMWMWRGSDGLPELRAPEQVYVVSDSIRIVRQEDRLHGRAPHSSLWLECIQVEKESIVLFRKELHGFQDTVSGPPSPSERECHGYILHPLLVPMRSQVVCGTAFHSLRSLRTRGHSAQNQIDQIVAEMPRHVLQWEDSFVHDTSRL